MEHEEIVKEQELLLLKPEIRKSAADLDRLLADDFLEFGSSGNIYNKKDTLEMLPGLGTIYEASDLKAKILSEDIIQTTFRTTQTKTNGQTSMSLRSSIWKKIDGSWQMIFHQGTLTK